MYTYAKMQKQSAFRSPLISCQTVRRTSILIFFSAVCLKGLAISLGLGLTM